MGCWLIDKSETLISGNRIRYTYADGINFHAGDALEDGTNNAVVENNSIRSTCDDGVAAWSQYRDDRNLIFRYNNIENPWHANCIALYGGTDISVYNNILKDTSYRGAGVNISTDFAPKNFRGKINVFNNLIIRCGGDNEDSNRHVGAIWFNMVTGYDAFAEISVKNNVIADSTHQGISFEQSSIICSLVLEENVITGSGSYGIDISSNTYGNIFMKNNSITNSALEDVLDNHKEGSATVITVNDEVIINSDNGASIALWSVAGVLLGATAALAAVLVIIIVKRTKKEDK